MNAIEEELRAFETGALDPAQFPHSEHVRLGYEMLARYPFGETVMRFSRGLKLLAAKAGRPEIYHETITIAFLALLGERRTAEPCADWNEFRTNNADLLDKRCLEKWYGKEQLSSELARRTFCLPQGTAVHKPPAPFGGTGAVPSQNAGRHGGRPSSLKLLPMLLDPRPA